MFTPLEEAQYRVVHEFPGGAVKLASRAGMSGGTLSNKVNPAMEGHKLSVAEAILLQNLTKDYRILYAEAAALNHVAIRLGDYSGISDVELLNAYAHLHQELGEVASEINRALADNHIHRPEFNAIAQSMDGAVRAMFELRARLEALIDER